jgi:hypothetical protein
MGLGYGSGMQDEKPDQIVHGSYTYKNGRRTGQKRTITAVREYRSRPPQPHDCIADFDDYDLGDRRGYGETPEAALDDLLEQEETFGDEE